MIRIGQLQEENKVLREQLRTAKHVEIQLQKQGQDVPQSLLISCHVQAGAIVSQSSDVSSCVEFKPKP
jgi:beta-lactam-binding protein with PASTA domain